MSTRHETDKRKASLRMALREACLSGKQAMHNAVPPVRELAATYSISPPLVRQVLQELEEEGVLYAIPRVGTFIGTPPAEAGEFYAIEIPERPIPGELEGERQIRIGFEDRVAARGGGSLVFRLDARRPPMRLEQAPLFAGIFVFDVPGVLPDPRQASVPVVWFGHEADRVSGVDLVSFDDLEGGRIATRHLLGFGHRRIAFLALHGAEAVRQPGRSTLAFSIEREAGWREVMAAEGLPAEGLAFRVNAKSRPEGSVEQADAAYTAAQALTQRSDITAVVTANDAAANGLLRALKDAAVPVERWPAIVGFDDRYDVTIQNVSSFRLPWEEVGRVAADLLWERSHGILTGPPVHRRVSMRLIQRLTSRPNWTLKAGGNLAGAVSAVAGRQGIAANHLTRETGC